MNSEDLELSLRSEFENYLKDVVTGIRQDVSEFQKNFESEFAKHKSQLDDAFRDLLARFETDAKFEAAFTETVVEHLRLARDDGALITATAIGEAEKLTSETAPPQKFDQLRDAVNEISSKTSQSAILKALVDHAAKFTPRGAFFILKNENFVGWKVFGKEGNVEEAIVNEINLPVGSETLLAAAVENLETQEQPSGKYSDDSLFLDPLEFGRPDRMYAMPLIARGRGVAVLYADYGSEGVNVNVEALETLVRVAGMTVELLAASQAVRSSQPETPVAFAEPPQEKASEVETAETAEVAGVEAEIEESKEVSDSVEASEVSATVEESVEDEATISADDVSYFEPAHEAAGAGTLEEVEFEAADSESVADVRASENGYAEETNGNGTAQVLEPALEPMVEVASVQPMRGRVNDRQVDLPIEVAESERRQHNDARRFARLLVSEIKLYNEHKVSEGREVGDLYDRLKDAVDRSREMYEKRVLPVVAAKFDYFHYEIVNTLAQGDDKKLGGNYPGSSV